jgi:hypothetical protein
MALDQCEHRSKDEKGARENSIRAVLVELQIVLAGGNR